MSNTLKQFVGKLPTNCLSVFDYVVKLALKGLNGKSQVGGNKKTKLVKFSEKQTFLIPWLADTNTCVCILGAKECLYFGIFSMLCFLTISVLLIADEFMFRMPLISIQYAVLWCLDFEKRFWVLFLQDKTERINFSLKLYEWF